MTAGVPGLGLSGLFVLLSVIFMPIRHGPRPATRPPRAFPLLAMGAVIGASIWLSWEFLMPHGATTGSGLGRGGAGVGSTSSTILDSILAAPVILISLGIVVSIVLGVEALSHVVDCRPTPTEPQVRRVRLDRSAVSED